MTPSVPYVIAEQKPWQRLDNILWEQRLNGYPPFGAGIDQPMICLSESPPDHLLWLLGIRHWPPWGLVFSRSDVYDLDGGPVWYARQKQYDTLDQDQRRWAVRFTRAESDWLHEREWRIPLPPGYRAIDLGVVPVAAILIAAPNWQPSLRTVPINTGYPVDGRTEDLTHWGNSYGQLQVQHVSALPRLWQITPRFYWDSTTNSLIGCGP
jgi:hypothetical protein